MYPCLTHAETVARARGETLSEYVLEVLAATVADEIVTTQTWRLTATEQAELLRILATPAVGPVAEVHSYRIRVVLVEPGFVVTPILQEGLDGLSGDPASPYAASERRMGMLFAQAQHTGGAPQRVAEVIAAALDAPEPKLRYLVGDDAEAFAAGRVRTGDETWVAMGRHESDEAYFREFAERFPMPTAEPAHPKPG